MNRLASILQQIAGQKNPPVHTWHPDQVVDIDMLIHRDGSWSHQGRLISRRSMVKLFASILRNDNGQHYLVTPVEKCPIHVESTPFVIVFAEQTAGRWFVTNNLDDSLELTNQQITWLDDQTPAITWRGQLAARISQSTMYQLQLYALDDNGLRDGKLWLTSGEHQILLGSQ